MGKVTLQTRFIIGAIAFVIALAALVTAANTDDAAFHTGGLVIGALGFAVCWLLMKIHFDRWERDPNRPRRAVPRPPSDPDEPADMTPPPAVPAAARCSRSGAARCRSCSATARPSAG